MSDAFLIVDHGIRMFTLLHARRVKWLTIKITKFTRVPDGEYWSGDSNQKISEHINAVVLSING